MTDEVKRLSLDEKLKIAYCIPHWLRDEQIRLNTARVKERISSSGQIRHEPIALVNYGPSLNDTWEKIREFQFVLTCSGAHKFLVERGIIPTWHIDVDPRKHKIDLLGEPQKATEYLIASTCHPDYLKYLEGYNVKLWHIFDNSEDGLRLLPPGEWALTGGCSAGVRTLTMARFLGFVNQHVFGMDGCEGKSGKHAAAHPNQPKGSSILEYKGVEYRTTPAMLEAARNTFHELDQMKDVNVTFYGEGLVQALARDWQRKEVKTDTYVGFTKPELISAAYCELNHRLHEDNLAYGVGGGKHAKTVLKLCETINSRSVLDYGCGKGYLAKELPFPIWEFDPAIPGKTESPRPADLVVCTDVLEHVEPDRIDYVLLDLRRCVKMLGYFSVHTGPSTKNLADGRNTHLIQEGRDFWAGKLSRHFCIERVIDTPPLLHFFVSPPKREFKKAA